MALASALILILGFLPSYFHRSAEFPPLTPLYQLHGAVFTAWIVLLVAQTALVAARRSDIHRTLGVAGAVLAAVVFIVGVAVSVETLAQWRAAGRRSAQVLCHSARRYHRFRRAGRRGRPATPAVRHAQAADAGSRRSRF
jgi:hypothetical protein